MRSYLNVFWIAPFVLASLLTGCVGCNSLVSPPKTQDSQLEHVSKATFDERVLKCEKPVLVDYYTEWCGPCKKLGPVLDDFAQEHPDIRVVKVNIDENPGLASRYEVKSIPCLLVIRGGQVTSRSLGVVTKEYMKEMTTAAKLKEIPAL